MNETTASTTLAQRPIAGWKKALLVVSVLMMGTGVAVPMMRGDRGAPAREVATGPRTTSTPAVPGGDAGSGLARSLVDSGTASSTAPEPEPEAEQEIAAGDDVWSALLFKLGFSFFVGFALGYAVRTFFKYTIVGIGMMLFMLFGLEYAGLIEVHWAAFEGRFDSITGWLQQQTGGF